ncbi:MAG TPA: ester cyclase [Gemmatimonadaceae bacterium]|nr:ester cyclase [Gemmatimonadaceae bacterium]
MNEDFNKQQVRRLMERADAGDLAAVLGFYADDYIDHDASESRSGQNHLTALREAFPQFYAAFPDTRHTIDDMVAEGDRVAVRMTVDATHTGPIFGFPATGKVIRNDSIVIYRFKDGQIQERWCREHHSTRSLLER